MDMFDVGVDINSPVGSSNIAHVNIEDGSKYYVSMLSHVKSWS